MGYNPLAFFMIELNTTYIHYKNKKSYIPINFCKIQENDVWVNNNNQYQPMDAYTATGAGGTVSVNNF
jgi:hypothetical protein